MNRNITKILLLLILPSLMMSQSINDSILLKEINVFESKLQKHSIGSRNDVVNLLSLNLSINESFSDILQNNTTLYVKRYGSLSTPSFRGTSASHTLFLWNGIPINSLSSAQTDLRLIPTNLFNDINISYGGNSTVFGSGSVGGSIHLNNKAVFKKNKEVSFSTERGSFNMKSY